MIRFALLCFVFLGFAVTPLKAQTLVTGLSVERVQITSDFTGTELVVFGTIDGIGNDNTTTIADYDIIVEIEGPKEPGVVRKKERTLGIWINREGHEFGAVPGSYLMMTTRDPEDQEFQQTLSAFNIGFANLALGEAELDETPQEFRDAILRLKQTQGLYFQSNTIDLIGNNLFKAEFKLPAIVPVGIHQVRSYLIFENQLISGSTHAIRISKSGFEQILYRFTRDHGYIYGVVCVLMAMLIGWLGSVIFKRD